jgi:hypothetical protein
MGEQLGKVTFGPIFFFETGFIFPLIGCLKTGVGRAGPLGPPRITNNARLLNGVPYAFGHPPKNL